MDVQACLALYWWQWLFTFGVGRIRVNLHPGRKFEKTRQVSTNYHIYIKLIEKKYERGENNNYVDKLRPSSYKEKFNIKLQNDLSAINNKAASKTFFSTGDNDIKKLNFLW